MKNNLKKIFYLIAFIWIVFIVNLILPINLNNYGIVPRTQVGLIGIFFSPFLHGSILHITSNTIPLAILSFTIFNFYPRHSVSFFSMAILFTGILVWIFGRSSSHIGASGLIYAEASFIICSGFLIKDFKSILISILCVIGYGGLIWGVLPTKYWISWEGHIFGAISGIIISLLMFKKRKNA
jgi:membrane associated rhomboid family serine protease